MEWARACDMNLHEWRELDVQEQEDLKTITRYRALAQRIPTHG
jgi:hypothetical protein